MIPRRKPIEQARPRNHDQSLAANLSEAAHPVPPLRLLGSAADKDRSAAAPIAASSKPKEVAPKPKELVVKSKVALVSSSKRKHHNRARPPQRSATQAGAKLPASQTAASNAARCADMWRTSTAPTPARRSKSTPGPRVQAPLEPLPEAGSSLADFKWAWKQDDNPTTAAAAAAAAAVAAIAVGTGRTAGTGRTSTAGTGRVDAAARLAYTQQQQLNHAPNGGLHSGWGQIRGLRDSAPVKPLSQMLQEQWDQEAEDGVSSRPNRLSEDDGGWMTPGGGVRRRCQQC